MKEEIRRSVSLIVLAVVAVFGITALVMLFVNIPSKTGGFAYPFVPVLENNPCANINCDLTVGAVQIGERTGQPELIACICRDDVLRWNEDGTPLRYNPDVVRYVSTVRRR